VPPTPLAIQVHSGRWLARIVSIVVLDQQAIEDATVLMITSSITT